MTRDEAIKIEERKIKSYTQNLTDAGMYRVATANIDALIELGVLKVDEPKSIHDKLAIAVKYENITVSGLIALLSDHGLKVTLK